jgi:MoaA/NifB/PqqE/SkfB family radical SAM enzyme
MLEGERPQICKKCFQVEDAGGMSVRQGYMQEYRDDEIFHDLVSKTQKDGAIEARVRSLDFSLSNNCNLKCIMCSPDASFPIKKDFDKLGIPYDTEFTKGANENWKDSAFFEKIIPDISSDLKTYLTTGGEPFLSKPHMQTLKLMIESGNAENIMLQYHTNCTVDNQRLYEVWNNFKHISVHLSIDAFGELGEYIRFGSNFEKVNKTVDRIISHKKTGSEVHTCVQVLNIFNLDELYDWIKSKRR